MTEISVNSGYLTLILSVLATSYWEINPCSVPKK